MPISLLLAIYLILPVSLILVASDIVLMNNTIRSLLPANPETTLWYGIIFGLPHILASMVTLVDREYLSYFKSELYFGLPIIFLLTSGLIIFASPILVFAIMTTFTIIHVVGQQVGISKILSRQNGIAFTIWKWCLLILAVFMMFRVSTPQQYWPENYYWILNVFSILAVLSLIPFIWIIIKPMPSSGRWYMASTQLMVVLTLMYAETGYSFLCILVPRFVHDCSAFLFYVFHDINRNKDVHHNVLYGLFKIRGKMIFWFIPIFAIGAAAVFNYFLHPSIIMSIIFFHYFMERKMWRGNAPLRQQIYFK